MAHIPYTMQPRSFLVLFFVFDSHKEISLVLVSYTELLTILLTWGKWLLCT